MKIRRTRQANADIKNIYKYTVEKYGALQAELYLGGLDYTFDLLTDQPRMGKTIGQNRHRYRYKEHYVFYQLNTDVITILRIRGVTMKLPKDWQ